MFEKQINSKYIIYGAVYTFVFLFVMFFLQRITLAPYMLDDFSAKFESIDLNSPRVARGLLWVFFSHFLYTIPVASAHLIIGLLHVFNGVLIVWLLYRLWGYLIHPMFAPVIFLFFVGNPILSDNLLWLLAGYPVVTLLMSLLATHSILTMLNKNEKKYVLMFVLFSSLAYFSNEQGLLMLPLYLLAILIKQPDLFSWKKLNNTIFFLLRMGLLWLSPYIAYRVFLYIFFGTTAATQPYERNYDPATIIKSYIVMIHDFIYSFPFLKILFAMISMILLIVTVALIKRRKENPFIDLNSNKINLTLLGLFILFIMGPFALLGGWLEFRFLYIPGELFIVGVMLILAFLFSDLQKQIKKELLKKVIMIFMALFLTSVTFQSLADYNRLTLKPVEGIANYINRFLFYQQQELINLPSSSTVIVTITQPNYTVPQYLFGGGAIYTLKAPWVPAGMQRSGMVPTNITSLHIVDNIKVESDNAVVIYNGGLNTELLKESIQRGKLFLYVYDGDTFQKVSAERFVLLQQDNSKIIDHPLQ